MPASRAALPPWSEATAFLAGGTWLFSEPQPHLHYLVDLQALKWPRFEQNADILRIGATCTLAELEAFEAPLDWRAAPLFARCARALAGSFKVREAATVGGNICLALPAAPMVALAAALEGTAWVWRADGTDYHVPMAQFVLGPRRTALQAGELLRSVDLPVAALRRRAAVRHVSLTTFGRAGALLLASIDDKRGSFALTITASTVRPIVLTWPAPPMRDVLDRRITDLPPSLWLDDVHGAPAWRQHMTRVLAGELLLELTS